MDKAESTPTVDGRDAVISNAELRVIESSARKPKEDMSKYKTMIIPAFKNIALNSGEIDQESTANQQSNDLNIISNTNKPVNLQDDNKAQTSTSKISNGARKKRQNELKKYAVTDIPEFRHSQTEEDLAKRVEKLNDVQRYNLFRKYRDPKVNYTMSIGKSYNGTDGPYVLPSNQNRLDRSTANVSKTRGFNLMRFNESTNEEDITSNNIEMSEETEAVPRQVSNEHTTPRQARSSIVGDKATEKQQEQQNQDKREANKTSNPTVNTMNTETPNTSAKKTDTDAQKDDGMIIELTVNKDMGQTFKSGIRLANEFHKCKKTLLGMTSAFQKDSNTIIIKGVQKDQLEHLSKDWPADSFGSGIATIKVVDPVLKQANNLCIMAYPKSYIAEEDREYLINKYEISKIDQINSGTLSIQMSNKEIFEQVVKEGYFRVGTMVIRAKLMEPKTNVRIAQCWICQKLNHYQSFCPTKSKEHPEGKFKCMYCAGDHKSNTCEHKYDESMYKCCICPGDSATNNHKASDKGCPTYMNEVKKEKERIKSRNNQKDKENSKESQPQTTNQEISSNAELLKQVNDRINKAITFSRNIRFDENINKANVSSYQEEFFRANQE